MRQENAFSAFQNNSTGVKIDPTLKKIRLACIVMIISAILIILNTGGQYLSSSLEYPFNIYSAFFTLFYVIFAIFYIVWIGRYGKSLELRRQAAARGNRHLVADEQPVANEFALMLPLTIGQRPKWKTLLIFPMITLVIGIITFFSLILFQSGDHPLSLMALWIGIIILLVLTLLYGIIIVGIMYRKTREQITLTEHGLLQVGMSSKIKSIPWSEARLFAINGIIGAKKYPKPSVFELSSSDEVIRWGWMRKNNMRVISFAKPTISQEEYEQTMNGVLSVIAAKTGLALYDLRKDETK